MSGCREQTSCELPQNSSQAGLKARRRPGAKVATAFSTQSQPDANICTQSDQTGAVNRPYPMLKRLKWSGFSQQPPRWLSLA